MECAATCRAHGRLGAIQLIGVLAVRGLVSAERAAWISRILILHTGLIHNNSIARGVECLAVKKRIERGGSLLGGYRKKRSSQGQELDEHFYLWFSKFELLYSVESR